MTLEKTFLDVTCVTFEYAVLSMKCENLKISIYHPFTDKVNQKIMENAHGKSSLSCLL